MNKKYSVPPLKGKTSCIDVVQMVIIWYKVVPLGQGLGYGPAMNRCS